MKEDRIKLGKYEIIKELGRGGLALFTRRVTLFSNEWLR